MRTRLWINPDYPDLAELENLGFAGTWQRLSGERVDENRLRCVERVETKAGPGYLKRFFGVQPKNELKLRLLQGPRCASQAQRERLVIERLRAAGFGAPACMAWGDETRLGHERRSLLLTAPLAGTALSERLDDAEELLNDVATYLGRVVRAGVFLPDLGLDHVFVVEASAGLRDGFGLLDFHNARFSPAPSGRELGRAVVRFFRSPGGAGLLAKGMLEPFADRYLAAAGRESAAPRVLAVCRARLAS